MNRSKRYAHKLKQRVRAHQRREIRAEARALAERIRADLAKPMTVPWWKFWDRRWI